MNATEVTAGLAESNGSLLLGLWRDSLHVTCGLTACTPGSAPGPKLDNEYGKTLPFFTASRGVHTSGLDVSAEPLDPLSLSDQRQRVAECVQFDIRFAQLRVQLVALTTHLLLPQRVRHHHLHAAVASQHRRASDVTPRHRAMGNGSVPKIIINDTMNLFSKKTAIGISVISNHNSSPVLFDKTASFRLLYLKNLCIF